MSTLTVNKLGVIELAKRTVQGNVIPVSEVLSVNNEYLQDAVFVPANGHGTYTHTRRLTLPDGTFRNINAGVAPEASLTKQIVENVGRLETRSRIDVALLSMILGDKQKFRSTEDAAFLMGLGQTLAETWITGDTTTDPEKFDGLDVRMNALSSAAPLLVQGAGATGSDLTSVYFIRWGEADAHFIFLPDEGRPSEGFPVKTQDLGEQTVLDGSYNPYQAYETLFTMTVGFAHHDDRNLGRMANIEDDVSGANIFEPDIAVEISNEMGQRGRGVFMYAHQKVLSQLDIMAMDKPNALYNIQNLWGEPTTFFRVSPVRHLESIGITQSALS